MSATSPIRIFVATDGRTLVPEGHPTAATLFAPVGEQIGEEKARAYGFATAESLIDHVTGKEAEKSPAKAKARADRDTLPRDLVEQEPSRAAALARAGDAGPWPLGRDMTKRPMNEVPDPVRANPPKPEPDEPPVQREPNEAPPRVEGVDDPHEVQRASAEAQLRGERTVPRAETSGVKRSASRAADDDDEDDDKAGPGKAPKAKRGRRKKS